MRFMKEIKAFRCGLALYLLVGKSEETYAFEKFYEEEGMVYSNNIPLLRTPEIYYAEAGWLASRGGAGKCEKSGGGC